MRLICTDVETGGLDPYKHSLLSVAFCIVDTDSNTISNELSITIKEDPLILTEGAMKVNNMTLAEIYRDGISPLSWTQRSEGAQQLSLQSATSPGNASQRVCEYLRANKGASLLGHNVSFDYGFLCNRLEGVKDILPYRTVDTSSIARFLYTAGVFDKDISNSKALFDHFGIPKEGRHTALCDCMNTAKVYLKMMDLIKHNAN